MSGPIGKRRRSVRLRAALRRHGLVRRPRALRELLRAHGLHFTAGNRVRLFEDGAPALAAMLAAIEAARRRVHLETYILRGDRTGLRFIAALEECARRGVTVRLLYDAFGSLSLDPAALADLAALGAEVVAFNPLHRWWPKWLPRRRDHRKVLTVDGRIGFVGGLNIGEEYDTGPGDGVRRWRDTHAQIEGPAVLDLEAVFLESWFRADGPDLHWRQLLASRVPAAGEERCAVLADGPSYKRRVLRDLLVAALQTAERRVLLTSPYFAPDGHVLTALADASARGVAVCLLFAGRTDHPVLRRASRALLPRLLAAGVQVYEYEASMLHAKTTVVDTDWSVLGTSNLDRQSFEHSYEVNVVNDGGETPSMLAAMFDRDLAAALRIDDHALASRGWVERCVDRLCAVVLRLV
jgi:cardiolipin synthase